MYTFPVIDVHATGKNITRLRKERGLSVRDLQAFFGFEEPQAIYKWQWGQSLPSLDNFYALSAILDVPMEEILVSSNINNTLHSGGRSEDISVARPHFYCSNTQELVRSLPLRCKNSA